MKKLLPILMLVACAHGYELPRIDADDPKPDLYAFASDSIKTVWGPAPQVLLASNDVGATVSDWYTGMTLRQPTTGGGTGSDFQVRSLTIMGSGASFTGPCTFNASVDSNWLYVQGCATRFNGNIYTDGTLGTVGLVTIGFVGSGTGLQFSDLNGLTRVTWGSGRFLQWSSTGLMKFTDGADGIMVGSVNLGTTGKLADTATAPTVTACSGGTAATVTWHNGSAAFRFDVGTACTSESTAVITLPDSGANPWTCACTNVAAPTHVIKQSGFTDTTATMQNYAATLTTTTDWVDGADIQCMCRGGG